eukprot:1589192-Rhodomonas_salina.2
MNWRASWPQGDVRYVPTLRNQLQATAVLMTDPAFGGSRNAMGAEVASTSVITKLLRVFLLEPW